MTSDKTNNKFHKFKLLMWKNYTLLRRRPIHTAFEIILPVGICLLLVVIRTIIPTESMESIVFEQFRVFPDCDVCRPLENADIEIKNHGLAYSPSNSKIDSIFQRVETYGIFSSIQPCNNSQHLEDYATNNLDVMVAVQFDDDLAEMTELPDLLTVTLRLRSETNESEKRMWYTEFIFPPFQLPGPRDYTEDLAGDPEYVIRGFLTAQQAITYAILEVESGVDINTLPTISMQRFSYPEWNNDPFLNSAMENVLALLIMMSLMYNYINTIRAITTEKEKQLKESMKIMGLPGWLHWVAWFLRTFIILFVVMILMVLVLKVNFSVAPVFAHSDWFLLLLFLLAFACCTITFSFLISVFFSKANTAAAVGSLVYFLAYLPYALQQQQYDNLSLGAKIGSSFLSNSALSFGLGLALKFEGIEEGVQWSTLFTPVSPNDDLTFGALWLMLIFDAIIYLLIALYVEAVFPGDFGVPQPWYFPFTRAYWFNKPSVNNLDFGESVVDQGENFERTDRRLSAGIQIKNLRKVFGSNEAVKDLKLDMYEGQITVLLGHNGAGKTTTMSMITGMFPPTAGTAIVGGYDIRTNISGVRDSMGLCLQHNVLFDNLTVREHLYFFGKLKGLQDNEIEQEINKYIKLLELDDKRNAPSSTLSGGMKRKLSVGMALCGKSKVVMLDEPTAGMDPSARRAIWDLLQKEKQGRTILLTTHFMDEADLLGDRIAIMAGGTLQCCGSSFFLKKRYGAGYYLIMDISDRCIPERVTKLLRRHIPDIEIQSQVGSELTYLLYEGDSKKFEPMLLDLENNSSNLGIEGYGVSLTTMEEVFMKVGVNYEQRQNNEDHTKILMDKPISKSPLLTGFPLLQNQFISVILKKFLSSLRSWLLFLLQVGLPIVLLIITVLNARSYVQSITFETRALTLDDYEEPITLLSPVASTNEYAVRYKNALNNYNVTEVEDISQSIIEITKEFPSIVKKSYVVGATFNTSNSNAWFNGDPYHALPLSLGFVLNAYYKTALSNDAKQINFVNHPLPLSLDAQANELNFNLMGYQIALELGYGMAFVASFYILFYIKERVSKSKHLQFVSGMNVFVFWGTAFLCDLVTYLLTVVGILITVAALQEDGFKTGEEIGRLTVVLLYFGCSVLPLIYLASHLFPIPSTGFSRIMLLGALTGIVGLTVMQVLEIPNLDLLYVANPLHWVLLFLPFYSIAKGIYDLNTVYSRLELCQKFIDNGATNSIIYISQCSDFSGDYFGMPAPGIGRNLLISFLMSIVLFVILLLNEFGVFSYWKHRLMNDNKPPLQNTDLEVDVLEETKRIRKMPESQLKTEYALVVRDLTKYYKNFLAVNGLCLGVKSYECFGLLGVNGAGKSTTFKMMTGDEYISHGEVWVQGLSISKSQKEVQKLIGYCPQFDALLDDLTARETLMMFSLIRGVPLKECRSVGEELAFEFDFHMHLDKQVKELSGGNKRKLSTAIALIGDPPVIYLDEPTTGMDPETKRHLWKALCKFRDNGKTIILTSHSMEECEALCTRLAIMVNGTFQCLGSTQRLKNKFAQGFALTIKLRSGSTNTTAVENFVQQQFPGAELREKHQELLSYRLVDNQLPWSRMFGVLEKNKAKLNIEDYSLGQCSLEQVFLSFTKHQV